MSSTRWHGERKEEFLRSDSFLHDTNHLCVHMIECILPFENRFFALNERIYNFDMQKPTNDSWVNLRILYDGVTYAFVVVPTNYKFGKGKLKELLRESFKQQTKIEIVIT